MAQAINGLTDDALVERVLLTSLAELRGSEDVLSHQPSERKSAVWRKSAVRNDVSAGPMMHASATGTLFEEVRRFVFAIEWLEVSELLERRPDGTLSLVHDRSGGALEAWKQSAGASSPRAALHQLTSARGERYYWDTCDEGCEIGGDHHVVVANPRWRNCRLTARFRNVVLLNCDFRGTQFDHCRFEGATFVNCLLDDANFEYCDIVGATGLEEPAKRDSSLAPSFIVDVEPGLVPDFLAYARDVDGDDRDVDGDDDDGAQAATGQFFSDTSGTPASRDFLPSTKGRSSGTSSYTTAPLCRSVHLMGYPPSLRQVVVSPSWGGAFAC